LPPLIDNPRAHTPLCSALTFIFCSLQCALPERCGGVPRLGSEFSGLNISFALMCGSCSFYVVDDGGIATLARAGTCPTTCTSLAIDGHAEPALALVQRIGSAFKDMPGLHRLSISNTQITDIANTFEGLPNLSELFLGHNKIKFVSPNAFDSLHALGSLVLEPNPLTHVTLSDLLYITEAIPRVQLKLPTQYWLRKLNEMEVWRGVASANDLPVNRVTMAWGSAEYARCEQPYTWQELRRGYKDTRIAFKTGGLGRFLDDEHEAWLCLKDHPCADVDEFFCFVYNERSQIFIPWAPNSLIGLLKSP